MVAELTELTLLEKELVLKMRALPREKAAQARDFIEFLREHLEEDQVVDAAIKLSEESLRDVWDDDSDYDRL